MYRLFQYYKDELTGWNRTIGLHKEELGELVRKIVVGQDQQIKIISATSEKESGDFIDQFLEAEHKFDHITNLITSQQQRLERSTSLSGKPLEPSICQLQNLLRTRMNTIERNFIRIKYICSIFLSSFLNEQLSSPPKMKILNVVKFNYGGLSMQ